MISNCSSFLEMRFSQILARAARTEYRTPALKHPYQPGKTFGFLVSACFVTNRILFRNSESRHTSIFIRWRIYLCMHR